MNTELGSSKKVPYQTSTASLNHTLTPTKSLDGNKGGQLIKHTTATSVMPLMQNVNNMSSHFVSSDEAYTQTQLEKMEAKYDDAAYEEAMFEMAQEKSDFTAIFGTDPSFFPKLK